MKVLIVFLYIIFTYYTSLFSYPIELANLWGHKTTSFFDLWTLQHVATGTIIAYLLTRLKYFSQNYIWTILLLSLFWESLELILELGHLKGLASVGILNSGIEFWMNRSLTDPASMIFGAWLFYVNKKIFAYAIAFTVIWLLKNLYAYMTMVPVEVFI